MKHTEYLEWDWVSWVEEWLDTEEEPKSLHVFQETKINMHHFSGLSIHGCLGASNLCRRECYDARGVKVKIGGLRVMKKAALYTYLAYKNPEELEKRIKRDLFYCTELVRVHVGGDFVSPDHIRVWQRIARETPTKKFFAYTRSWRHAEMIEELNILNNESNFRVYCSVDAETGLPQKGDMPIAQMSHVYNVKSIECPEQKREGVTCATCQICTKPNSPNLIFHMHGGGRNLKKDQEGVKQPLLR